MKKGIILSSLILSAVLLTSCNTSSATKAPAGPTQPSAVSDKPSENKNAGMKEISLSEAFRAPERRLWYFVSSKSDNPFGKDTLPHEIFVFENGKFSQFNYSMLPNAEADTEKTLGDYSKMTDDEIVSYLNPYMEKNRTEGQKYLERMLKGFEYMQTEGQKSEGIKAASAGDPVLYFVPSETMMAFPEVGPLDAPPYRSDLNITVRNAGDTESLKNSIERLKSLKESRENQKLDFAVITDQSGNVTTKEIMSYTPTDYYFGMNSSGFIEGEDGKFLPVNLYRHSSEGLSRNEIVFENTMFPLQNFEFGVLSDPIIQPVYEQEYLLLPVTINDKQGFLATRNIKDQKIILDTSKSSGVEVDPSTTPSSNSDFRERYTKPN